MLDSAIFITWRFSLVNDWFERKSQGKLNKLAKSRRQLHRITDERMNPPERMNTEKKEENSKGQQSY